MRLADLATPALVADADVLDANLRTMSAALPGARLRPHVKAHKSTALAKLQAALGHRAFTCATVREMEGMAAAGLGDDLLLANEVLDARRLGALDARVTAGGGLGAHARSGRAGRRARGADRRERRACRAVAARPRPRAGSPISRAGAASPCAA